ncbi:hypothetical protein NKH49_17205 [Mesorhizobium sp. M1088]|uniref:hypothetical protein n=1 Tax=Mesorhizobium sp. M1088 TaxID=2957056 RepID=UPI003336EF1F
MKALPEQFWIGIAIAVVAALALVPLLPGAIDSYAFSFLFFVFIYATMAQGWNLVAGFGGQISLGNHAFFGSAPTPPPFCGAAIISGARSMTPIRGSTISTR